MPVNCQITVTIRIGGDSGSTILRKMRQKPAPSMRAALIRSSGIATKKLRQKSVVKEMPWTHVDQHEAGGGVGEAEVAEDEGPGHQRQLAGHEDAEEHAGEEDLGAAEAPLRQDVAVDRAERRRDDGRRDHHPERVEEVAPHPLAGAVDAVGAPGLVPGLEREAAREGDQPAGGDLRQVAEGVEDDDEERHEVDRRRRGRAGRRSPRGWRGSAAAPPAPRGRGGGVTHGWPAAGAARRGRGNRAPAPPRGRAAS